VSELLVGLGEGREETEETKKDSPIGENQPGDLDAGAAIRGGEAKGR
jgi:hypothetical protein